MSNQSRIEALSRAYVMTGNVFAGVDSLSAHMVAAASKDAARLEAQLSEDEIIQASDLASMEEARMAE